MTSTGPRGLEEGTDPPPGFRTEATIGAGAQTTVHRAVYTPLGITVALKRWRSVLTADQHESVLAECRLQWSLSAHPNIVGLYWASVSLDGGWTATELYDQSLADRLTAAGPPLTEAEALTIADDLLTGLAAVHDSGHVHRDVKPANVLLRAGRAALGDLGIAVAEARRPHDAAAGTPPYVAPEVESAASPPSRRSDVWSAAQTIQAMFPGDLPARVVPVIDRAQSFHPADRPADAGAFLALLREGTAHPGAPDVVEGPLPSGPSRRPPRRTRRRARLVGSVAGAGVAAGVAAVVFAWWTSGREGPTAPSAEASATAALTSSASPSPTPTPSSSPSDAARTAAPIAAPIAAPADGAEVTGCEQAHGSIGALPAGRTLMTSISDVSDNNPNSYWAGVSAWRHPEAINGTWDVKAYFGEHQESVTHRYEVALVELDLSEARRAFAASGDGTGFGASLPPSARTLASHTVVRVAGPSRC